MVLEQIAENFCIFISILLFVFHRKQLVFESTHFVFQALNMCLLLCSLFNLLVQLFLSFNSFISIELKIWASLVSCKRFIGYTTNLRSLKFYQTFRQTSARPGSLDSASLLTSVVVCISLPQRNPEMQCCSTSYLFNKWLILLT